MLILGIFILLYISAIASKRINGIVINRAAVIVLFYSLILSLDTLNVSIIGSGIGVYGGLYQVTVLSKLVEGFIYILAGMILSNLTDVNISEIKKREKLIRSEYSIIALFSVIGGILMIKSNDLISMYLSIELQSFGLYILATIYRDSQAATSAGLKYFLLGGLSSGLILLGSSIIYGYTGVTNLESIYLLLSQEKVISINNLTFLEKEQYDLNLIYVKGIKIGLLVMTVGFLFKVASAPFHNWAADVYDGVPVKVTTWLAIMGKISILTFLLDLVLSTSNNIVKSVSLNLIESSLSITNLILIGSILSLLIGTIVALSQSRIKRLLAYSTISHVGFLLLAIGINEIDSTESFIFYLIQYSLTSANAFFVLIGFASISLSLSNNRKLKENDKDQDLLIKDDCNAETEYSAIQFISQLKGKFNEVNGSRLLALSMAIILFSMAGIPPLVGFFAKQAVLLAALKNGFIFMALIGIITSVISAAYYLKVIKVMIFDRNENSIKVNGPKKMTMTMTKVKGLINKTISTENLIIKTELTNKKVERCKNISNSLSFSISILTVLTIFFVLKPLLILNSAHIMALSLFYL